MGPTVEKLTGTILQGTYRIERLIGKGGMGAVFRASHLRLSRPFAIKMLVPDLADKPEALARFRREAEVTSAIGHPNILEIIDFSHDAEGAPYIVMELLEGDPLSQRLRQVGRFPLEACIAIFRQLASALQAAHDKGVVHRDLKPQNIFLCRRADTDAFVKVFDFGISKVLGSQSGLTQTHAALGTPYYMSPEQAQEDAANVDLRTDIFALGAILYELLTGQPPFTGDNTLAVLFKIVHKPHPPLLERCPELPEALEEVMARALSKDRQHRFSSMAQFWGALALAVGGQDTALLPASTGFGSGDAAPLDAPTLAANLTPPEPPLPSSSSSSAGEPLPGKSTWRVTRASSFLLTGLVLLAVLMGGSFLITSMLSSPSPAPRIHPAATSAAAAQAPQLDLAMARPDLSTDQPPDARSDQAGSMDSTPAPTAAPPSVQPSKHMPRRRRRQPSQDEEEPTPFVPGPAIEKAPAKAPKQENPPPTKTEDVPRHIGKDIMPFES